MALAKLCSSSVNPEGCENSAIGVAPQLGASPRFQASLILEEKPSWFAIFTRSHHEKKVAHYLMHADIENFLPLYSQVHNWTNRRRVTVQLPLFPNYLFVRSERQNRGRVLRVPGVLSLVGRGFDPTPMSDFEVEALRSGLHLRKCEPHPLLVVGARVRIKVGPLEGMEGVLLRNKNNLRVVLTVGLINQSVAVEVDASDVESTSPYYASSPSETQAAS